MKHLEQMNKTVNVPFAESGTTLQLSTAGMFVNAALITLRPMTRMEV